MHTPKTETIYTMEMMAHMGPDSLDAIATRVYGRSYAGQQTGDMIRNDSYVVYDMTPNFVDDLNYLMDGSGGDKRHFLSYNSTTGASTYIEGVNWFEYWLALEEEEIFPGYTNKSDLERAAPTPDHVLADLIKRGELPHGKYLLHVWW